MKLQSSFVTDQLKDARGAALLFSRNMYTMKINLNPKIMFT